MQSFVLMIKKDPSVGALLLANLVPVIGFLFFEWSFLSIIFVYWAESVVIGLYTIPKILISGLYSAMKAKTKTFRQFVMPFVYIPFFCFHIFGVLGAIMVAVFSTADIPAELLEQVFLQEMANVSTYAILGFVISHGISFLSNFIGKKEYQRVSADAYVFSPYLRVILLGLIIFFGGILTLGNFIPGMYMIIFIIGKINVDIWLYILERSKYT